MPFDQEQRFGDVTVSAGDDHVATVTIRRPPDNYFDQALIASLGDAYEAIDADPGSRAILLCAEGKHFCAGAQFGGPPQAQDPTTAPGGERHLYDEALRLFAAATPVVAAIQGAAIGGGLGLAMSADFRVGVPESRMSANFARLGFHHGFGLTVTLPATVGQQRAMEMLLTGVRLNGEAAHQIGLLDRLVGTDELLPAARAFAADIALSSPLAVRSIRATMRAGLVERIRVATDREKAEQDWQRKTADFAEGVRATRERRPPRFTGT
ncbi:MAG: short chain 3-hydroxyacyl-CoA dehydrogenase / enoyl-CoA hydratase [Ilumatobacteraceae bacterium]|nr:short chain 3-hydroxyacyl-CoA dehydrogenase / enoyl-CoA hydratase [Ilumatobacteraceae bacterium]